MYTESPQNRGAYGKGSDQKPVRQDFGFYWDWEGGTPSRVWKKSFTRAMFSRML